MDQKTNPISILSFRHGGMHLIYITEDGEEKEEEGNGAMRHDWLSASTLRLYSWLCLLSIKIIVQVEIQPMNWTILRL